MYHISLMKKLLYPLSLILTAFLILYSCSPEEERQAPTSTVPTPEPEPQLQNNTPLQSQLKKEGQSQQRGALMMMEQWSLLQQLLMKDLVL